MIEKLEISGIHYEIDDNIQKYVGRKIGRLDRFMPREARDSAHAEVKLKDNRAKDGKEYNCEVVLYLPHDSITVHEATLNMYAAVDIVEAKLRRELKKYKEKHGNGSRVQKVLGHFRDEPVTE